jgi:hypothetical protein
VNIISLTIVIFRLCGRAGAGHAQCL